jgi:hypothetical protein
MAGVVASIFILASSVAAIWALYLQFRTRQLQHTERLAAIQHGVALPELGEPPNVPSVYLLRGLQWLFSGIALCIFLVGISITSQQPPSLMDRLSIAKSLETMGATTEQIRQETDRLGERDALPIGGALLGLIPMGVGAAYLISYRVERKRYHDLSK